MLEAFATLLEFMIPGVIFLAAVTVLLWACGVCEPIGWKHALKNNPVRWPTAVALLCVSVALGAVIDFGMYGITGSMHDWIIKSVYDDYYAMTERLPVADGFFNPAGDPRSDPELNREWFAIVHHRLADVKPWATTSSSRLQAGIHLCLALLPSLGVTLIASIVALCRLERRWIGVVGFCSSGALLLIVSYAWYVGECTYHRSIFVNAQIKLHYDKQGNAEADEPAVD